MTQDDTETFQKYVLIFYNEASVAENDFLNGCYVLLNLSVLFKKFLRARNGGRPITVV